MKDSGICRYFEKALKIDKDIYGENHPSVGRCLYNLGLAWNTLGDLKKAVEYLQESYRIFQNVFGDKHPYTKSAGGALGFLCKE